MQLTAEERLSCKSASRIGRSVALATAGAVVIVISHMHHSIATGFQTLLDSSDACTFFHNAAVTLILCH